MLSKRIYYLVLALVLVGSLGIWVSPSMARTWGEFFQHWMGTDNTVDADKSINAGRHKGGERWQPQPQTPEAVPVAEKQRFGTELKIAVTVGINAYPELSGLRPLDYARADAEALGEAFKQAGYITRVIVDGDATKGAIIRTLQDVKGMIELKPDQSTVIFAFSGHGFQGKDNNKNYLATVEAWDQDIQGSGLALEQVQELLIATGA
ncbi:hypothetical protein TI04_06810, partial [Achromatium sp. WMS2]